MKVIRDVWHAIRNRPAKRMWFGMAFSWLFSALVIVLTDAWIGVNWLNSPAPGFIVVGLAWLLIAFILVWRDR